jgi:transposase InsO family protein/transposase-like protein
MYSYEDKIRAVELYIKLGKRVKATIRQLGYPTKNALKGWYREHDRRGDLTKGYHRAPKYTIAQQKAALDHFLHHGRCIDFTRKALGYPCRSVLRSWIDERHPELRQRSVGQSRAAPRPLEVKQEAVIALCTRQGAARAIARGLGVSRETLYNWKDQLLGREAPASMKRQSKPPVDPGKAQVEQQLEALKGELRRLQLEHDLLKKANEILKKDLGVNLQLLTNREKTMLVDALRPAHAVKELLAALCLARSSYFYHRGQIRLGDRHVDARRTISDIFARNRRCYGYRRMHASLRRLCIFLSEKVVRRLMKQENLIAATPRRRRYGSYLGEISPAPDNLINRDFRSAAPNQKWLTDITEFQIPAGKVYLSPIIDCFDGLVVSWSLGTTPDAELVNTMLDTAIETVANGSDRPIVHSDRGAHYRWPGWLSRIDGARLIRSMSRKACSPDNAACEGFFGRLKNELFYPGSWQSTTIEHFIAEVDSYIRWYNEQRIKMSLGSRSPMEYRANLGYAT